MYIYIRYNQAVVKQAKVWLNVARSGDLLKVFDNVLLGNGDVRKEPCFMVTNSGNTTSHTLSRYDPVMVKWKIPM